MSLVGLYNMALVPLGVDRIMDPNEETEQARKCNELYPYIRDDEISSHPWNFSIEQEQLAVTTDTVLYGYSYAYQIPSDCLRVVEIYTNDDAYRVVGDKIYTDESPLYISYIKQITDTNKFPPYFKSLIAARLKFELCYSLTGSKTMTEDLYNIYMKQRKYAKGLDAQEGTPKNIFSDRITDCRSGGIQ